MSMSYIEVVKTKRDNKVTVYSTEPTSDLTAEIVAAIELVCKSHGTIPEIRRRESIVLKEDRGKN